MLHTFILVITAARVLLLELAGATLLIIAAAQLATWAALATAGACLLLKSLELDMRPQSERRR